MFFNVVCHMWYMLLWQQFPNPKLISPKGDNKHYLDLDLITLII